MKLYSVIRMDVPGDEIVARPGMVAKLRQKLGGKPDLSTGQVRAALEAGTVVDAAREAFTDIGVTNAVSLVVDDVVLFHDRERRVDDLGDLFLAFHDAAPAFGEFRVLRLCTEHVEAGVHHVIEIQARREHPKGEAAARVVISGRLVELQPRPGEDAEQYRTRVEPLVRDQGRLEVARVGFDAFVARVQDALARVLPEARCTIEPVAAPAPVRTSRERPVRPDEPGYDPHEAYYPNPLYGLVTTMMLGSMMMGPLGFGGGGDGVGDSGGDDSDGGGLFGDLFGES